MFVAKIIRTYINILQDSIPVRCKSPACQLYVFWCLPLGVTTGWALGPQVNTFEQLFSDDHQISGVWGRVSRPHFRGGRGRGTLSCDLSNGVFPKCLSLNSANPVTKIYDIKRTLTCH